MIDREKLMRIATLGCDAEGAAGLFDIFGPILDELEVAERIVSVGQVKLEDIDNSLLTEYRELRRKRIAHLAKMGGE